MKRLLILCLALIAAACSQPTSDALQGYGEADYVYLSSQDPGIVGALFVREGDRVAAGAPVFRLDPERLGYEAQSASAQHSAAADAVRTAQANAVLAERNYARGAQLAAQGFY
ncbi:MAG: biotin/lipoyl-binding protein, partial [Proteobacteria bacterium]|nr:biotin/lipoyl-binding protein [Pseudomonadota bacterium]